MVANNLANLNTTGYSSSQVDRRKVGKLAVAIQVAFQELGVFPASSTMISVNTQEPVPFNTVQAIENAERTAALGRVVPPANGVLGASESGDLSSLRQELEDALAPAGSTTTNGSSISDKPKPSAATPAGESGPRP
jgi:hypothetical protein